MKSARRRSGSQLRGDNGEPLQALEPRVQLAAAPPAIVYDSAEPVSSVVAADFNGDGRDDLAIAAGREVALLIRKPNGQYKPARTVQLRLDAGHLIVGTVNGDRFPDLVAANDLIVQVMRFRTKPGRLEFHFEWYSGASSVVLADLDGDRRDEFVFTRRVGDGSQSDVHRVRQSVRLEQIRTAYTLDEGELLRPAATDMDGDGDLDLVYTARASGGSRIVAAENITIPFDGVMYNTGFESHELLSVDALLGPLVAADLDGSGTQDLIAFAYGVGGYDLRVYGNDGGWSIDGGEVVAEITPPGAEVFTLPTEILIAPGAGEGGSPVVTVFERRTSIADVQLGAPTEIVTVRQFERQGDGTYSSDEVWSLRNVRPRSGTVRLAIAADLTGEGRNDFIWIRGGTVRQVNYTSAQEMPIVDMLTHNRPDGVRVRETVQFTFEFTDPASSLSEEESEITLIVYLDVNGNGVIDSTDTRLLYRSRVGINGWAPGQERTRLRERHPRGTFNMLASITSSAGGLPTVYRMSQSITILD